MDYSNKIRNIYDQHHVGCIQDNNTQKQYMIGYVDQMTNNLIEQVKYIILVKKI